MERRKRPNTRRRMKEDYNAFIQDKIIPIAEEILLDNDDCFGNYVDLTPEIQITDGASKSGFISFTDGTIRLEGIGTLMSLWSGGYSPSKEIDNIINRTLDDMNDDFFREFEDDLAEIGITKAEDIFYNDLSGDLQSEYESYEESYLGQTYFVFRLCAYFRDMTNRRSEGYDYECNVFADIVDEYGRNISTYYEDDFFFNESDDLKDIEKLLEKYIKKAVDSI